MQCTSIIYLNTYTSALSDANVLARGSDNPWAHAFKSDSAQVPVVKYYDFLPQPSHYHLWVVMQYVSPMPLIKQPHGNTTIDSLSKH